ncbi:DUF1214 domain-containing protein [Streptomyces sp900116325]|uniref:DUF1214 domain-containing protein n=1 Tax=Streptomyces sp. 900116325 TaxID=3154295 RepID=UPI003326F875
MAAPRKYLGESRERGIRMCLGSDPKLRIKRLAAELGVNPEIRRAVVLSPINRYEIGCNASPAPNPDGSVDLYMSQRAPSGKDFDWLPAPTGQVDLLGRYWPEQKVLNGMWSPLAVPAP